MRTFADADSFVHYLGAMAAAASGAVGDVLVSYLHLFAWFIVNDHDPS